MRVTTHTNLRSEEPFSRRGVPLWSPADGHHGRPQGYAPTQDHPANIALPNATWYQVPLAPPQAAREVPE